MIRLLLSAITTMLVAVVIGQRATAQTLQVHHANGAETNIVLGDQTTVKFLNDRVLLSSPLQTRNFAKADVLRFTYTILHHDVNGDGKVDVADIASVIDVMAGAGAGYGVGLVPARSEADVNGDGAVDVADIASVIDKMAELARRANMPKQAEAANVTIGEAFYIYRNDGQFNAFFREEIDSISFSHYDADGLRYNKIASQVVYTPDSTYMIPLVAIDSVGFVTPETEYKPGVIRIEGELRNYVSRQDSLTIFFSGNIPSSLIPHVGDKLVTLEMSDMFPVGFAGEVAAVKNNNGEVEVVCVPVGLEEVFECYYGYSEMEWDGKNLVRRFSHDGRRKASGTFAPGRLYLNLINEEGFSNSYQPNDELSYNLSELRGDISVTPVIWGSAFTIVQPNYGVNVSLTVTGDYNLEENFSLKGGLSWKKDIPLKLPPPYYDRFFWPIAPLVDVYLKPGLFIQAQGEFALQQTWTQHYRSAFHYEYSSKGEQMMNNMNKIIPVSSGHSGEAALKGKIGAGFFLEVGFDFIHTKKLDLANVNLRAEAGVNLEGNFVLTKSAMESAKTSTAVYEQLRDTELSLNWFYGVSGNAKFWKWGISRDVNLPNVKLNNQGKIYSLAMAPTFSDVEAKRASGSKDVNAKAKISVPAALGGRCIAVDAGFVLKDEDGDDVSSRSFSISGYNGSQGTKPMDVKFTDVPNDGKKYKVYPHIKWMGVDILASPEAEVKDGETSCPDENHPHWIDLGIGTQWRCCNEGASRPEEYGGYYTFGQVASAPTLEQIKALVNNCSYTWTTQNGVNGGKFTGPNGGTIFLPAAGYGWDGELGGVGSSGRYWSSTPYDEYIACILLFASGYADLVDYWYGNYSTHLTVRPVR